ncbi:Gag-Pol [Cucumis melo var. makuwa]|uniref:Gag-Pol n=1 Tax=Cucumis melo var. makuwa TaxID=1194695 RepID=A0A5D3C002_CUCMM|nr:Gag-Pol [Cucumis melo var. makuwa]
MLGAADLKKTFWAKAVNTACYIVNRSPSTIIELKTPMQSGLASRLIIQTSIYLEGYRLWDSVVHKVIISRVVVFMDDKKQVVDDSTINESLETTTVHVEKEFIDDSFEAEPIHEIQEPIEQQDNMLVAGPNKDRIEELKAHLARRFEMKGLGTSKLKG